MKKALIVLLAVALLAVALLAADEGRFFTYPTIAGDRIVFTYESDLWTVSARGGVASRLTTFPGTESFAKLSPDGRQIAFTATYDGAPAAYLMPAEGGAPVRLTYNPGGAAVVAWTPDGSEIVFRSTFENVVGRDPNLYAVPVKGGAPERLPLDRGVLVSFIPEKHQFLYCRRGNEEYYWKRYKGGQYQDIWLYDAAAKTYTPVTDYVGKNSYPMWAGGAMYFVSDRTNGIANLYVQKLGAKDAAQVTKFADFDVMFPQTDGRSIVYVQDGRLHVFDVASGQDTRLAVRVPSDRWALRDRVINPRDYLHTALPADDGAAVILEARGDVYRVPAGPGPTLNLSATPGSREIFPALSPDGKTAAFFSDRSGSYQLYTQPAGGGDWTQITTTLDRTVYRLAWSPDGRKILFGNKDYAVFFVDLATRKLVKVDSSNQMKNDEFVWEMADYAWSPDSKWIAYSFVQANRNSQIFLYNIETGRKVAATTDFYDNLYPAFDADGRYLYYVSSRNFALRMDFYEDNHVIAAPQQVMAVQLRAGEAAPFAGEPAGTAGGRAEAAPAPFRVDADGLIRRTTPLPVPAGNYFWLKAGKGKVLWASIDEFTEGEYEDIFKNKYGATQWTLHIFDMASRQDSALTDKVREFWLSTNGERLLVRRQGDIFTTTVDKAFASKAAGDKLDLGGLVYTVDLRKEWRQIFDDAWRWYSEFFYDAGFHGRDWKAMGDKYRAYLPDLSSRGELNWVLSQMVGELCVSHTYIGGGDYGPGATPSSPAFTGLLGADLVPDKASGLYRLARIYGPTDINLNLPGPLARPDMAVKEGDFLLAIGGTPLKAGDDYFKLLQTTPGKKISVTVNALPSPAGARTYDVEPVRSDQQMRYFRWIDDNIKAIDKATNGRVGYMHINAMGGGGVGEFDKYWRAFRYKEGVIIDVRRNSGGWTEYFLIDKLERQLVAYNNLRDMVPFRYPGAAGNGNYVVISNENNGSDGEAFVEHFKARKLGTVVGVPSWGGLVGILNQQLTIDNGTVEQSNNAFYGKEGTWWVENHGADPDVVVDNDPGSVMAGRDLQLEKAIAVMLEKIQANPLKFAPKPAYPKK
ncbi:MAG TPA: S41 family peptidase [Candidatus Aminicenantes bacterium]|nr:S41 family peptidase [Candidatus Aminicenantes bacterium]HRY64240.1 S41 family peptidase [Candidatus Aminicenantes bacterium]HRZ71153.1 S41 family peptidase [Candidatus Aminicenantes bacterium]